jgi:hypothetical protein
MLIKAYFEAQAGGSSGGGSSSSYTPTTPPHKKEFKTEEERRNYEKTILNNLCADFGVNVNQLQPMPKRKIRVLPSKLKKGGKS